MMTALLVFGLIFIVSVSAQLDMKQYDALKKLYKAIGCNVTICANFMQSEACVGSSKFDLQCSDKNVTAIHIFGTVLSGSLPSDIGQLTALTVLSFLGTSGLAGTLPSELWRLTRLTELRLDGNQFNGTINTQIGLLTKLRNLFAPSNRFSGSLPSQLGRLSAITSFGFNNNLFVGSIPSELGRLTDMTEFLLQNNDLTGKLPSTLSSLTRLDRLNLSNNKVTGVFVTNASVSNFCMLDATFLDCNKKPSQCSCSGRSEPQNDECDNRFIVSTGSTDVATVNSSCSSCYADSPCEIFNDVWFEWRATCTGQATIDACNLAPANTRLGVYRGVCPAINTGTLTTEPDSLDCDDFGGCGGSTGDRQERATIVVSSGESIVVRIGAASPSTFLTAGNFSISCSGTSVLLPTTTPTTTTSEIPALVSPSVNVGAMVGGVLGGLAALLFVVGLAVWVVRRNRNRTSIDENELHNLEHVADGAFGKVYKAYRKDEWVAVKTVNHDALGRDEDILNEVAVLKKIGTHNHIVAFRGFTTVNGQPALVLKFYDAGSLLSKLTNARNADWPKERQLKVASGIAAGVAYLHRNGIIHRDLAARNVLLTSDDVARVTDFGLSLKSSALEMKASSPAGAVSWMAPEQLIKDDKGQYTFSTKSDVYSFGVVLFELFERKAPWSECESRAEIVNKLQSGETLKTNDRKYPSDVIAIVKTCWLVASERDDMATVEIELTKLYKAAANPALYVDNDAPHPAKAEYFDGAGVPVESSTESN